MSNRRSRVDIGTEPDESPAAKRRKHGEQLQSKAPQTFVHGTTIRPHSCTQAHWCNAEADLKAAAQAAAKKALANVTTIFFDDADPPARPSERKSRLNESIIYWNCSHMP